MYMRNLKDPHLRMYKYDQSWDIFRKRQRPVLIRWLVNLFEMYFLSYLLTFLSYFNRLEIMLWNISRLTADRLEIIPYVRNVYKKAYLSQNYNRLEIVKDW